MNGRQQLRNLALEMVQAGSAMMKSGSEVLAEYGEPEQPDIRERVNNELSDAALHYQGLRIDRLPKKRFYEFFVGGETDPYTVMSDSEVYEWATRGPGALTLKIESDFVEKAESSES